MIPYLRPLEMEAVWKKVEAGPCARMLTSRERNWIALFKAVSRRDSRAMAGAAQSILSNEKLLHMNAVKFAVASGMAGHLMEGEREAALKLWSAYSPALFGDDRPDLFFRLLMADSIVAD
jgi:hypothetical protein